MDGVRSDCHFWNPQTMTDDPQKGKYHELHLGSARIRMCVFSKGGNSEFDLTST